jgi:hypothetical protein
VSQATVIKRCIQEQIQLKKIRFAGMARRTKLAPLGLDLFTENISPI